jgi:ABC-type glycerol-3-phosphate transport system substrate-binding protein
MANIKGGGTMPMKVKVFWEKEPKNLEESINDWLKTKPDIHVAYITQSQVQHGQTISMPVIICIWYTE